MYPKIVAALAVVTLASTAYANFDIFPANQTQFFMSYDRACQNSFRGQVHILDSDGKKTGAYQLTCAAWQENLANLQLVDTKYKLAGKTLVVPGSNGGKRVYLYDNENNVVALINQAKDEISVDGVAIETSITVYDRLGSFPIAYISAQDFNNGILTLRDTDGNPVATVEAGQDQIGSCVYPKWSVNLLTQFTAASDPRIVSLILSYLVLSAQSFNSCTELDWKSFGYTLILPSAIVAAIGIVKIVQWGRKKCSGNPNGYLPLHVQD